MTSSTNTEPFPSPVAFRHPSTARPSTNSTRTTVDCDPGASARGLCPARRSMGPPAQNESAQPADLSIETSLQTKYEDTQEGQEHDPPQTVAVPWVPPP